MKTVRGFICASALALLLGSLGCSPKLAPEHKGDIVPGQGIKGLSLGEDRADVEKDWGKPADVYENPFDKQNVIVAYQQKGVEVSYRDGKVNCINLYPNQADWKAYEGATAEGIWVNSNEQEVRQAYGAPLEEARLALSYPGLYVYLADGKVSYLAVTPLGGNVENTASLPGKSGQDNAEAGIGTSGNAQAPASGAASKQDAPADPAGAAPKQDAPAAPAGAAPKQDAPAAPAGAAPKQDAPAAPGAAAPAQDSPAPAAELDSDSEAAKAIQKFKEHAAEAERK